MTSLHPHTVKITWNHFSPAIESIHTLLIVIEIPSLAAASKTYEDALTPSTINC